VDDFPIREKGWECPKCERVWAPKIRACGACNTYTPREPVCTPRFTCEEVGWNYTADDRSFL